MTDYVDIKYTKVEFIKDIILVTLYSFVLIFLTFVLYKVNKI